MENAKQRQHRFHPYQFLKSRKGQRATIIVLFLFIPMTLLITFTYLPFEKMIEFSFYKMKYLGRRTPVGLKIISMFLRERIVLGHYI